MTRLCGRCGHPLTAPFIHDPDAASRIHATCTPEAEAARDTDHGDPGADLPEHLRTDGGR